MWHSRQRLAGFTGQTVRDCLRDDFSGDPRGSTLELPEGIDFVEGDLLPAWHERQRLSLIEVEVWTFRCGSWQVTQLSSPSLSVKHRLQPRPRDWKR